MLRDTEAKLLQACVAGPEDPFWKLPHEGQGFNLAGLVTTLSTLRDQKGRGWSDLAKQLNNGVAMTQPELQRWLDSGFVSLSRFLPMLREGVKNVQR